MSDVQARNRALMKGAAAFELLMGAVGTELHPSEDPGRVEHLRTELNGAVEDARAARYPASTAHEELAGDEQPDDDLI